MNTKTSNKQNSIIETITTVLTDMRMRRDELDVQISELEGMLSHYESELQKVVASLKGVKAKRTTKRRGRGRPKGSKNKPKTAKRGPGRPKGSKNKPKVAKGKKVEKASAPSLKATIVSMLKEYGEPVHVNELQHRLESENVTDNAKTVAVTLSALRKAGEVKKGDETGFWAVA